MRVLCSILLSSFIFACSDAGPTHDEGAVSSESETASPGGDETSVMAGPERAGPERAGPERPPVEEEEAQPPQVFEASPLDHIVAPAIGQWVRYGLTWRNGGRSRTKYSIVDREAGGWWVEIEDQRRGQTRHIRLHVRVNSDGRGEILDLLFRREGQVQRIPPRLLPQYQPMLEQWLTILFPQTLEGETQTVTVPAGEFEDSHETSMAMDLQGQHLDATLWRHAAVPVTGIVRLQDSEASHRMELIGFGLDGARSVF